jgi:hypothetical protein
MKVDRIPPDEFVKYMQRVLNLIRSGQVTVRGFTILSEEDQKRNLHVELDVDYDRLDQASHNVHAGS